MRTIIFLFITFLTIQVFAQKSGDKTNQSKPISTKDENRVVFIGDSITDFWDEQKFGGFFPGKPYINRGVSGQTTQHILTRFQQDVIDLKPKVVVILAGTNDIYAGSTLEQTGANISAMAEMAKANKIKVVISSVLPISDTVKGENGEFINNTNLRSPDKILAMNKWLKNYAAKEGFTYLDYYGAMADKKGFVKDGTTYDGLHPNANGYKIMNPLAEKAIKQALKSKK